MIFEQVETVLELVKLEFWACISGHRASSLEASKFELLRFGGQWSCTRPVWAHCCGQYNRRFSLWVASRIGSSRLTRLSLRSSQRGAASCREVQRKRHRTELDPNGTAWALVTLNKRANDSLMKKNVISSKMQQMTMIWMILRWILALS